MGLRKYILTFLIIISLTSIAGAAWEGPVELISGTWGSNDDQFGIKYGDTNDVFAGPFYILSDGGIVIQDIIKNARYKVYSAAGTLRKVLKCIEVSPNVYNEECNIDGEYIQTTQDGNIWVDLSEHQKPKYSLYSPTGALIRTTTDRPLELGKVKEKKTAGGYTYTVQYPDLVNTNTVKTYTVTVARPSKMVTRDKSGNLYIATTSEREFEDDAGVYWSGNDIVYRFNTENSLTGTMQIPDSQIGPEEFDGEYSSELIVGYGEPVISPTGDVYTWKRTPTTYSIIKWTWR